MATFGAHTGPAEYSTIRQFVNKSIRVVWTATEEVYSVPHIPRRIVPR